MAEVMLHSHPHVLRCLPIVLIGAVACSDGLSPPDQPTASRIAFATQPATTIAGATLTPVRVELRDSRGEIVTSSTAPVTLALDTDPAHATLGGTVTRYATGGIAVFDDITITRARDGYRLSATAAGVTSATSSRFDVIAAQQSTLHFVTQPGVTMSGAAIEPAVAVSVDDAFGNRVITNATVTIALAGGSPTSVLRGTLSRPALYGVAVFDDLTIDHVGTGYTLTASASISTVPSVTSGEFAVTSATIVFSAIAGNDQTGFPYRPMGDSLRVRLADVDGAPIAGALVRWTAVENASISPDTSRTNANGEAAAALTPWPRWLIEIGDSVPVTATARAAGFTTAFSAIATLGNWNWRFVGAPMGDDQVMGILVDPTDERIWYVWGITEGMYVTHDAGASWHHFYIGGINTKAVVIDPADPRRVFLAAGYQLHVSDDRGLSWRRLATLPEYNRSLHVSPRDGSIWYAPQWPGSNDDSGLPPGIFRSTDGGASFQHLPYGVGAGLQVLTWDIDENVNTGTLFLANEIADHPPPYRPPFFRSIDRGVTWQNVATPEWWHATSIQVDSDRAIVYALQEGPGLWKSLDDGASWTRVSTQPGIELLLDPLHPNRLFVGNLFYGNLVGGAHLSVDGGQRFWKIGLEGKTVSSLVLNASSTRLYATAYRHGIYVVDVPAVVP